MYNVYIFWQQENGNAGSKQLTNWPKQITRTPAGRRGREGDREQRVECRKNREELHGVVEVGEGSDNTVFRQWTETVVDFERQLLRQSRKKAVRKQ